MISGLDQKPYDVVGNIVRSRYFLITCFSLGLCVRIVWISLTQTSVVGDGEWYFNKALDIASGRGYVVYDRTFPLDESDTKMIPMPDTPTAFWPPGYPAFLATIFVIFGNMLPALAVAKWSNIVLYLGVMWLVYRCSKLLFHSEMAARMSVLILAFYPNHIAYTSLVTAEIFFLFLLFFAYWLLLQPMGENNTVRMAIVGMLFGLATLTKPQAIIIPVVTLAILNHDNLRAFLARSSIVYAVLLLVLTPWTYRNYEAFRSIFFVSNNSGINLLIGNNPDANGTYLWNENLNALVTSVDDERRRDSLAGDVARQYVLDHPLRSVLLLPRKIFYLYASDVDGFGWNRIGSQRITSEAVWTLLRLVAEAVYIAIFLLFFLSLWYLRSSITRYQLVAPSFLIVLTLMYMPFFGASRYHFPLIPWLAIYAGAALTPYPAHPRSPDSPP